VSNPFILNKDLMSRIQSHPSPASNYLAQNTAIGLPLWAEVMAEIVVDPTLITKSTDVTVDVDTDHGMDYGRTVLGPVNVTPRLGPSVATIILGIDGKRFTDQIVTAVQTDVARKTP
jgi:purine nucleosidase